MENKSILKLSFIISILGILILLFISNTIQPKLIKIKEISDYQVNQKVQIKGQITNIRTINPDFQLIALEDSTGKITALIDNPLNLTKNQSIILTGRIKEYTTEYKTQLEIQADKISLINN